MKNQPWSEVEIESAIKEYFRLLDDQQRAKPVNKAAIYRELSGRHPARSAKSFELKFQNISAILFEEKLPYADGLLPRSNYQRLLRLKVLDHLDRIKRPAQLPIEILSSKLRQLHARGFLPVVGKGSGRYGLSLEHHLGIPQNSSKSADFMGIELKTKHDSSLQTLFSRVPTRYTGCKDKRELVVKHGYYDETRHRQALYTSFSSKPDSLGFSLLPRTNKIEVIRNKTGLIEYDNEVLEEALLSKHSETAYVSVVSKRGEDGAMGCRFNTLMYCKRPSIIRFLKMTGTGRVFLDFTLSMSGDRVKDHGFLWRLPQEAIGDLYLYSESINLA